MLNFFQRFPVWSLFKITLLRVLQDKFIYRVGSPIAKHIDARVIAATNQVWRTRLRHLRVDF